MKKKAVLITRTAMYIAMTVALQTIFRMFLQGTVQVIVVGSLVNLILITSAYTDGLAGASFVSVISPVIAFLQGHLPPLVPFMIVVVALGNLTLVFIFSALLKKDSKISVILPVTLLAATVKTAALFSMVRFLVLPIFVSGNPSIAPPAAKALSVMLNLNFSWPQFLTVLIAGILFTSFYPQISKLTKRKG